MALEKIPQVLTIAGTDASGGAGLNADTRFFALAHVYAATVVTGITAQNTQGVQAMMPVSESLLRQQMKSVMDDLDIKAIKTGALFDENIVKTVADLVSEFPEIPLVIDPVMVAKGGAKLLSDAAIDLMIKALLPLADLITPNLEEAAVITGQSINSKDDMCQAAQAIQQLGAKHVLLKGGHGAEDTVSDLLYTADQQAYWYRSERFDTIRTHGTGDTLSAYITAGLAKGFTLPEIMPDAKVYMNQVIQNGIDVGHGHGPLNLWAGMSEENKG